jgi:hypothetical protein
MFIESMPHINRWGNMVSTGLQVFETKSSHPFPL